MFRKPCYKFKFKSRLQSYNLCEGRLRTEIYDKRDNNITFSIENIQFKCSNIPAPSAYGVYISRSMLYSRTCGSCHRFRDKWLLLTRKILNRGFLVVKQTSSLRKLYGRHHDLVNQIPVSQITGHLIFKKSSTTGVIIGAGTVPSPGSPGI